MILKLNNKQIQIKYPDRIEPLDHVYIKYQYELNTEHLSPVMTINDIDVATEDMFFLDLTPYDVVNMIIRLYNTENRVVKEYSNSFKVTKYCTLGDSSVQTIEQEITELNENIASLNQQMLDLEEKGEII